MPKTPTRTDKHTHMYEEEGCPMCLLEARLEQAEASLSSLRAALEVIAERGCGIPGHAVAVGCGSNAIAARALEGDFVKFCPDCHGHCQKLVFRERGGSTYGDYVPCATCEAKGVIPLTPQEDGAALTKGQS